MVAPGAGFRGAPFFGPKIGEGQKKGLRRKNEWVFSPNEDRDQTK